MELAVAAIQMESSNQDINGNLARALPLVEEAAGKGARLICLPEFMPSGYIFDESIWEVAEKEDGYTVQWLAEHAGRLKVTLGTSFIETTGNGFRNAFVLMGPEGEYGRVYKQDVALFENYFMEGEAGSHVIQTPMGNVGIGICYENMRAFLSGLLVQHDADILLQPHSCPALPHFLPQKFKQIFKDIIGRTPVTYAEGLGIPAVFINKCGPFHSSTPSFPYVKFRSSFVGMSAIVDSDGTVLKQVDTDTAVLVDKVKLDPGRKTRKPLPANGHWAIKAPWPSLPYMDFVDKQGRASYRKNQRVLSAAHKAAIK